MTLPEHGDLGWDTPLNNAVQAISADAAAAKADALAARNDAAYAKQAVDTVGIDDLASALSDAETAADTATTNASVATGAASSAQSYATQASTARSAAEDARDAAEAARTDLLSQKGAASGVAPLDSGSRVPQGNLPAHLDPTALTASNAKVARTRLQGSGNYKAGAAKVLQPFWAALAKRNAEPVDVLYIGTSLWAGTGSTGAVGRIPEQLLGHFRSRFPVKDVIGGYGYRVGNGTYGGPSVAGAGASAVNEGLGNRSTKLTQAGDAVTYANQTGTTVTIYGTAKTAADSITYDIGSGAYTGTITPGVAGRFSQTVTVPRGKFHVVLTWAAGTPVIRGINVQDGDETKGIRFWDCSKGGSRAGDWLSAYGGSQDWINDIGPGGIVDPDLIIFDPGLPNDAKFLDANTWAPRVQAVIDLLRTKTSAPTILWSAHRRDPAVTTVVSPWEDYVAKEYDIAAASSYVAVVDMDPLVDIPTVGADWLFDDYHPTSLGYSALAAATFEFLAPSGLPNTTIEKDPPYTTTLPQNHVRGSQRVYNADPAVVAHRVVAAPGQTADIFQVTSPDQVTKYLYTDSTGKTFIPSLSVRNLPDGSTGGGISVDGAAGQFRSVSFNTVTAGGASTSLRWIIRVDNAAETGSNAGSNFLLLARDDNGGTLYTAFSIVRSSRLMTLAEGLNLAFGTTTGTQLGTTTAQRWAAHGKTPIAQEVIASPDATDLASVIALANELKTRLKNKGICG